MLRSSRLDPNDWGLGEREEVLLTSSLKAKEAVLSSLCPGKLLVAKGRPSELEHLLWKDMAPFGPFASVVELLAKRESLVELAPSLCMEAVFSRSLA